MSTLDNWSNKIRAFFAKKHVQIGLIVFFVALLSFGVGYIFGRDFNRAPIVIEQGDSL